MATDNLLDLMATIAVSLENISRNLEKISQILENQNKGTNQNPLNWDIDDIGLTD